MMPTPHQGRTCGIRFVLATAAGLTGCATASSAQAQNFYCTTERMVDADRLRDPNYQLKRPPPGASDFDLFSRYEFFLHNGKIAISSGGYAYTFTNVALKGRKDGAYLYADRKGNRWTLTPLGGNRIRIAGPRVDDGAVVMVACNGPDVAPVAPAAPVPPSAPAPVAGQTFRFTCQDGFRFEIVAAVKNYVWPAGVTLKLPGQPAQPLTLDPADSDRATWKNAEWEFYSFKRFNILTELVGRNRSHHCS